MPFVKYRCAKCLHRLNADESQCGHCAWQVDLKLAEKTAMIFRRAHGWRASQKGPLTYIDFMILAALATVVVVGVLTLVNSLSGH